MGSRCKYRGEGKRRLMPCLYHKIVLQPGESISFFIFFFDCVCECAGIVNVFYMFRSIRRLNGFDDWNFWFPKSMVRFLKRPFRPHKTCNCSSGKGFNSRQTHLNSHLEDSAACCLAQPWIILNIPGANVRDKDARIHRADSDPTLKTESYAVLNSMIL